MYIIPCRILQGIFNQKLIPTFTLKNAQMIISKAHLKIQHNEGVRVCHIRNGNALYKIQYDSTIIINSKKI